MLGGPKRSVAGSCLDLLTPQALSKPAIAASSAANAATLTSQQFAPIRRLATFRRTVTSPANDVQVFDFGQNMAALSSCEIFAARGADNITIRHAELLTHPPYGPVDGIFMSAI